MCVKSFGELGTDSNNVISGCVGEDIVGVREVAVEKRNNVTCTFSIEKKIEG